MTLLEPRRGPSDELDEIASLAVPLTDPADLDPLIDQIGDARFVLLGNGVPTVIGRRYDALLSFAETTELRPLHDTAPIGRELQTSPWTT